MSGASSSDLDLARRAYAERRWQDAYDLLDTADRAAPLDRRDVERLGWAAALTGRDTEMFAAQERLHHALLDEGDVDGAARAAFWIGFRQGLIGERARASGWLSRAQRLVDGLDSVVHGYLLLPVVARTAASGDLDGALDAARRAGEVADRFDDGDLAALARNFQGRTLLHIGEVTRGLVLLDEAMVMATSTAQLPVVTGVVYCNVISCCHRVYALERAREWTAVLAEWCAAQPQLVPFSGQCQVHRSEILQLAGQWSGALAAALDVEQHPASARESSIRADACYQRAEVHRLRGELAAAEEGYVAAARGGREPHPGLALLRLAQGRADAAASALRGVLDSTSQPLGRARVLPALVEALLAVGDVDGAERATGEIEAVALVFSTRLLDAFAHHARGAVALARGDARGALGPLADAVEQFVGLGTPYHAARSRALRGRARTLLGDVDGAALDFELARERFVALGAAVDLAALPGELPGAAHRLTPREVEVLGLLARGHTNKEIGRALFVSERTVDRHVSNLFGKLDVSTRAAATAWAWEHGLAGHG